MSPGQEIDDDNSASEAELRLNLTYKFRLCDHCSLAYAFQGTIKVEQTAMNETDLHCESRA